MPGASSSAETEQMTLGGKVRTRLVNQRNTDVYDVDIGRADGGASHMMNTEIGEPGWLGNPYPVSNYSCEESIANYREDFYARIHQHDEFREAVEELRGLTLACWCKPKDCHGDVILGYLRDSMW